ncbi:MULTISPECIES: hypothetical protein [Colwellia]|uniref:Uncharacterized protein n=1 Tax=Colwellia marinimaniae TaxID=1513592 RepID=A0ABQ0N031_9GAMM|nr:MULTISPECIES: hypothetical protein [Colwellia]GAW97983.1 hypothetical protein MTCD1_03639 [Colwellia marinimaniae]
MAENDKDLAFYSSTLNAWYTTRFEKDKHLLSLSSAGIGLLVTLLTAIGTNSVYTAIIYGLALICFLISIISVLGVFSRNSTYLESVVSGNDNNDVILTILDKTAVLSFVLGIIFTLLVGAFSSIEKLKNKENCMSNNIEQMVNQNKEIKKKSLNGVSNMRPTNDTPQEQSNDKPASNQSDSKE